jgi:hypothetical protein
MNTYKKHLEYILGVAVVACSFFIISYYIIFLEIANKNALVSTIGNLVLIFIILLEEKLEKYFFKKLEAKAKYTVLLICNAILAAEPDFPVLREMDYYFKSVYYGILVLFAADKFLEKMFKDVIKQ